ncbi:aspartate/methionine/tyrosine aminotransferase [Rhizobium sp. SG_E_25_P2]|nr:aspartate/methionine/tyrosine aminotransferase [Rhizobium sp. SG_E_25_P2]
MRRDTVMEPRMPAFNPLVARLSPPPIPSVLAWAQAYDGSRGPKIDLSQAVPGYPPHPDMLTWLSEAAGSAAYTGYGAIEGEDALRQAYAAHVASLYGVDVTADNVHITSGANQAFLCAAMAVAGPGDAIALTRPFYFNMETTLAMLGISVKTVACRQENGFLPDVADVEAVLKTGVKAFAVVSPNNPTGAVYPADLLAEIFGLCRKHDAWLILDETYRDFIDGEAAPHGLMSVENWEEGLILTYSFSKSYCIPGHRLGAVMGGPGLVDQVAKVMDNLQICAPRAAQAALAKAIPALADWRRANKAEISRRVEALKTVMQALPDWSLDAIGAYFAYIRHPFTGQPSERVAEKLAREAGIVCLPGIYFGEGQDNHLRFAFANADAQTISLLTERLKDFRL